VYKPVADTTKAIGYKFASDGTALWTAKSPMADYCNDASASCRNIYTQLPGGSMIAFTAANASTLSPYLNTYDVTGLINFVRTLRDGQGIDGYQYFVDGSAKVADVKISGSWRTMVLFGEGPGGTFYQAFDGSLDNMSDSVAPDSDNVSSVLGYFNDPNRIPF